MKIHTLQIPPEGKHIEGEDPKEVLLLEDGLVEPCAPLAYSLDIGLSEGGVFATGTLRTAFKMACVSCLESFEMPVILENFACQADLEGREVVDLTEALREDILLALPAHPHCDWNGRNDCKGNPLPAAEVPAAENRREVWNALDRLKI
jgi:uncharacterized metal-binding protein YceD (DUF177 family)